MSFIPKVHLFQCNKSCLTMNSYSTFETFHNKLWFQFSKRHLKIWTSCMDNSLPVVTGGQYFLKSQDLPFIGIDVSLTHSMGKNVNRAKHSRRRLQEKEGSSDLLIIDIYKKKIIFIVILCSAKVKKFNVVRLQIE